MDEQWPDWTNLMLGIWLLMTPWTFSGDDISYFQSLNFWIAGGLTVICSGIKLLSSRRWPQWANLLLGAWFCLSADEIFTGDSRIEIATRLVGLFISYLCILSLWRYRIARPASR